MILESGNGMGGGSLVREGYAMLTAYAMTIHIPRTQLVADLRKAPGNFSSYWVSAMNDEEKEELGVVN